MKYARIAARIFNQPLLIEPSRLLPITNYLLGRMQGQSPAEARPEKPQASARIEAGPGGGFDATSGYLASDGIAVISITGELAHRAGGMEAESGLLSYTEIERRLDAALNDARVGGILLEVDSPGGEAAGAFTLAEKIFHARASKPIWALANEGAASAAYALASSASRVLLPQSAHVGSIGVIWQALDQTKLDQAAGLQYAVLQFGARKNDFNPHFPISPEALAWAQAEVARLGEQFVDLVARNRGLDPQVVRDTQAGLLFGTAAVEAGLADAILAPPGAGQTLVTKAAGLLAQAIKQPKPKIGANPMQAEASQAASGQAQATTTPPQEQGAPSAAQLEAAQAEGLAAGAATEKARIAAILNHPEAQGREAVARGLALETDLSPEAAAKVLAGAPKTAPNPLAQAMAGIPDPQVGPDAPQAQAPGGDLMSRVMARRLGLDPSQKGAR